MRLDLEELDPALIPSETRSRPDPDPDRPAFLAAIDAEQAAAVAERARLKARWQALPEAERTRIREAVRLANPALWRYTLIIDYLCYQSMDLGSPGEPPMPEPEKPRKPPSPPSIRTPGPDPVHRPIPAGAISQAGSVRNALAAADPTADADEVIPEATAEMVDIKHQANGRHPNRPTGAI